MLRTSLIRVLAILNILLIPLLSASNDLSITDNGNRYSFEVSHEDASAISLTLDVKDNALKQITYNGYQYTKADFGLEPTTGRAGWPDLPIISHLVLVPPTSDIDLHIDNIQRLIEDC